MLLGLLFQASKVLAQTFPTSRDPFLWPFAKTSIWNTPIGGNALYAPAGLKEVTSFPNIAPYGRGGIAVDEEPIIQAKNTDPLAKVYAINDWSRRCATTTATGKQIHFPIGLKFTDPNGGGDTPNYSGVVAQEDGSLFHFNAIATCGGGKIAAYDYTSTENDSWFSSGSTGGHGGSALSGFGGSIRKGELTGADPIRHAIKLNVLASRYLVYNNDGTPGYRWPATKADGYANPAQNASFGYGTSNATKYPYMEIGALLALKPEVTPEGLGINNPVALKLFYALQDYGAYVTDDTYWNHYDFPMESGVAEEVQASLGINIKNWGNSTDGYYQDVMKLLTNLYAVTNNGPNSIGGGGKPRQPLAPPFKGQPKAQGTFKIMPLGDSKTEGAGGGGQQSWRGYLRNKLMQDGYAIDYVGDRQNYADGDAVPNDLNHAGHGGYTIGPDKATFCNTCETTGIVEHLDGYFKSSDPDVVLVAIGINDFFNDALHPVNYRYTAPQRYRSLVNKLLQLKPSVKIILGTIEPVRWDKSWGGDPNEALGALNAKIKAIADSSVTDQIYFADIRNQMLINWSTSDYFDDVHLGVQGAKKSANAWYEALKPVLENVVFTPVAVTGIAVDPVSATLEVQTDLQLNSTLLPADATNKTVYWSSSNNLVAIVSSSGLVTGISPGNAVITVSSDDGNKTASTSIKVIPAPYNYAQNPGFELDAAETPNPQKWSKSGSNPETSYTETYNGAHGGRYHLTHYKGNAANNVYTYQLITGLPNGTYQLKAWIKSTGGQTTAQMTAKNFGSSSLTVDIPAASTWTQIQLAGINVSNGQCEIGFSSADVASWNYLYADDIQFIKIESTVTSVNDPLAFSSVQIYPNPLGSTTLNLNTPGIEGEKTLGIFDVLGRAVFRQKLQQGSHYSIDLNSPRLKGMYWVKISTIDGSVTRKLIVE